MIFSPQLDQWQSTHTHWFLDFLKNWRKRFCQLIVITFSVNLMSLIFFSSWKDWHCTWMSWKCSFLRAHTNLPPCLRVLNKSIFSFIHECFRKFGNWAERETPSTMEAVSRVQNTLILLMLSIVLFISINNYAGGELQAKQESNNNNENDLNKNKNSIKENDINKNKNSIKENNINNNNRSMSIMRTLRHLQASQVNVM